MLKFINYYNPALFFVELWSRINPTKKLQFFLSLGVVLFGITSCNRNNDFSSNYYMTFDSIEYVTKIPHTYILKNSHDVNTDVIGIFDFCIVDSFFIFATNDNDGLWSFVSLNNNNIIGQFLKKGQGPNEFLYSPSVQVATNFFKEEGNLYAAIYDSQKGKLYKMNIEKTIQDGELDISILKNSVPRFLSNFVMIDTTKFLCKAINNEATQQLRYLMRNNTTESSPNLEKLNRATINKTGTDMNIISTMTKYSKENDMVIEMPVMLNYLNIYSINENFGKTICIGDKLNNIDIIQNTSFPEIIETFYDLRVYKDFFAVLFVNEDKLSLETRRKKTPTIFLFNWQGEPIAELKLDRHLTAFDIDFKQGLLYGLDYISDAFFKYDIHNILNKFRTPDLAHIRLSRF